MEKQLPQIYRHPLPDDLYYEMALVRAGTFITGSEGEGAYSDEKPEHLVRLPTEAEWKYAARAGKSYRYAANGESGRGFRRACGWLPCRGTVVEPVSGMA